MCIRDSIKSTQPFVTLMGRDAFKNDKFQIAGDTLRLLPNGPSQLLPIVQFNENYASRISIRNLDKDDFTCMMINLHSANQAIDMTTFIDSDTAFCPNGGSYIPPHGSITINENILVNLGTFDGFGIVEGVLTIDAVASASKPYTVDPIPVSVETALTIVTVGVSVYPAPVLVNNISLTE